MGFTDVSEEHLKLMSLGYLQGTVPAPSQSGVTVNNQDATQKGLNFYISGHAPSAFLMDMEGNILHQWNYKPATDIWLDDPSFDHGAHYWRRAHLYKNGDVLAIYNKYGLIKIDRDSRLLWSWTSEKKAHHDLEVTDDGMIYVLTEQKKSVRGAPPDAAVLEDFITVLNPQGAALKHVSFFDLLLDSPYAGLINYDSIIKSGKEFGELFHANTLVVFDGKLEHISPLFKKGNIMLSSLWLSTIFIIDMENEKIVWALGSGMWTRQHQPELLDNGNILIFNNIYKKNASQILEFEPFTQKIIWDYRGDSKNFFYSQTCGSNQRLPNGNTLISETDNGRAFEVTADGHIAWEFLNPYRAGKKNRLIACIPEMIRLSPEAGAFLEQ
jgi:hypothetical protein